MTELSLADDHVTELTLLKDQQRRHDKRLQDIDHKLDQILNRKPVTVFQVVAGIASGCSVLLFVGYLLTNAITNAVAPVNRDIAALRTAQVELNRAITSQQQAFTASQVQFSSLRSVVDSNSKFVDRWYNTFRVPERDAEQEGRIKRNADRLERLEQGFGWRPTIRPVGD